MGEGWTTVLVALIGAAATVLGIVYTQRAAVAREERDRRERAAERRDDREREAEQAQRQASERRSEVLFARRIEAHERYLEVSDLARDAFLESLWADGERGAQVNREAAAPLYQILNQIRLFAGTESVLAAEDVYRLVRDFETSSDRQAVWDALQKAIATYRIAMRRDLGHTVDAE